MEVSESDSSSIKKWYQKQTVLVTGGSGFLGKALLFKLLQIGCPRTFVIIRPKKDQNPEKRLDTILQHEVKVFAPAWLIFLPSFFSDL